LLSVSNLLRHLGELPASKLVRNAIFDSIREGRATRDIGGKLSCSEFTAEVTRRMLAPV
jgi:isocitrate/isopropylmalate dehydrogenase